MDFKENKTCLLIIPKHFYSFEKHINKALSDIGYIVTVANDEYPEGPIGKVLGKLQIPLVFSFTYIAITEKFLKNKAYDIILIFKGRGISKKLLKIARQSTNKIVGFNWDSFKFNRGPLKWLKYTNEYYTFDFKDSDEYGVPVIELFSILPPVDKKGDIKYDVSGIMRNHSQRLRYLDKVLSIINVPVTFLYIYEQNIFSFVINFIKNPGLYIKYFKYIYFKPLTYTDYIAAIQQSAFTIDYAHSDQTGITMRCYESINMQTKIITNNTYMHRSRYFNANNTVVFPFDSNANKLTQDYNTCKAADNNNISRNIHQFVTELVGDV
jgi:hypothetical protein